MKLITLSLAAASFNATAAADACTGKSARLAPADCEAWQDLRSSTNGRYGSRQTMW
jgi:hypothetical protein